ncbi:AI-2E family transporter [Paraburkholderia sp.]|uniref:AI-2E family transporter n=1 Tax=Paraburkholderia sp. TaxID=1926495 RepID=UPI00286EBB97|nr:AI-2E family transporter [Paraburkholderia sp.]
MLITPPTQKVLSRELLDVLIRAGLVAVLAIFCFRIFVPFLNLMVWALILAITLYPLQIRLRRSMPNRDGLIATLIVLAAFVIVIVPAYLLGVAVADSVDNAMAVFKSGSLRVPPPAESVLSWPLVGKRVYDFWLQASTDIAGVAQKFAPQLKDAGRALLGTLTGLGVGLMVFFAALIVAGILMAFGEKGHESAVQIASRISGPDNGVQITDLCTATIRAVAQGVVGIAFIQMVLIGVAFIVMGIPGAGLLALAVLLIGIMQLPATLITVPVIIFVIVTEGLSTATIVFSVYVFIAGLADNVLKPLLLGRGVAVPMPVVLIGALGGMVTGGVIGLFIGPVMLAVGYQLFWRWVKDQPQSRTPDEAQVLAQAQTPSQTQAQIPPQAPEQQP